MIKRLKNKVGSDKHLSELLSGSAIAFIFRMGGIGMGYLFVLLVARAYGAEAMGVFILSFTVLQITSVISRLGMDTLLLRVTGEYATKVNGREIIIDTYKNLLLFTIPFTIFVSVILYLYAPFIAIYVFHKPILVDSIQLASFGVLPLTMLSIHRESLRGLKKIMIFSFFISLSIPLFATIILIILIYVSTGVNMPLYAQVIALLVSALFSIFLWKHHITALRFNVCKDEIINSKLSIRKMFSISLPMMLAGSLYMIMNWTDTVMLGMYVSEEEIGIYSVALKIATLTSITLMAINSIAAPKFAEMWGKNDLFGLEKIVQQSTKIIFYTTLPLLIIILLFPQFLLSMFGDEFIVGKWALVILIIGQFFSAISGSVSNILQMTGHQKIFQNIIILALIVNISLNYFLIPIYGINGAAIATSTSTILWNLSGAYYIMKHNKILTIYIPFKKDLKCLLNLS